MIFPIGDDQIKGGSYPLFSYLFIGFNVLIFVFQFFYGNQMEGFYDDWASIPEEILRGEDYHTLLSSMFLHGGWMHLIGNMMFLWLFADNIEATMGSPTFVFFYLLGGVAAAMAHIYFNQTSVVPMVGASGAISAVLGAYLVMYPSSKIKVWAFFFIFHVPAFLFLGFWGAQQYMSGMAELNDVATQSTSGGVAWWAHIGGFVFGLVLGFLFRASERYKNLKAV